LPQELHSKAMEKAGQFFRNCK